MSGNNTYTDVADKDRRTSKGAFVSPKFEEGQPNSHDLLDSKDERSIANRLEHAEQKGREEKQKIEPNQDPTLPARSHGNDPSKGARVDAELQKEESEYLERKGKA